MSVRAQVGGDRVVDFLSLVDQVGHAAYADAERSVCVVHADGDLVHVANQAKREIVRFLEATMARPVLRADADDGQADGREIVVDVANCADLPGA